MELISYLIVIGVFLGYFVIGSKFEERKLIAYHGEVYKKYQQKVAGVIPLPWKILSAEKAQELLHQYNKDK
ncbi:MAG: hypothetical protein KZQ70_08335 [gamma proteobacterium symbiont of Lucinoma myriamae]|nr:hypothetical protein [gamma proteobacterium symbiont of Lucinoma myriamae]MCU7817366.1 hypothetical protein [gamma proteobacterium symbiont of Lucinoma myriamae]MCU7832534.1 hypothetical protein [gamma proteobacterium symbiont of Lucinoma myriamae]